MIARYRLLAARLRSELDKLEQVVQRAEGAVLRASRQPENQDYFLAAAALDLHGFYAGLERLFELIAGDVDESHPTGQRWHHDLLAQMSLALVRRRPAVLTPEATSALEEYMEFRHVVRNVYTFNLRPARVVELVHELRPAFEVTRRDLLSFAEFLDSLAAADEEG